MTLSSETHTTIRILAACGVLATVFYFISKSETTPKEHNVNVRLHMAPSSK